MRCLRGDGAVAWDADCWAWRDSGDAGVVGRRLTRGARWQAVESGRARAEGAAWAPGGAEPEAGPRVTRAEHGGKLGRYAWAGAELCWLPGSGRAGKRVRGAGWAANWVLG